MYSMMMMIMMIMNHFFLQYLLIFGSFTISTMKNKKHFGKKYPRLFWLDDCRCVYCCDTNTPSENCNNFHLENTNNQTTQKSTQLPNILLLASFALFFFFAISLWWLSFDYHWMSNLSIELYYSWWWWWLWVSSYFFFQGIIIIIIVITYCLIFKATSKVLFVLY